MVMRFNLSDSLEDIEDMKDTPEAPCFPYPELGERPGGIDMWLSLSAHYPARLNLKIKGNQVYPEMCPPGCKERKVLLQLKRQVARWRHTRVGSI